MKEEKMNIYAKLNEARVGFGKAGVKKSGKGAYGNAKYFELADILPVINQLAQELRFICVVNFTRETAELRVIDVDNPADSIVFASPMSEANLKNCHAVQNLGAAETYLRRYLYQQAFEIVEGDALDAAGAEPQDVPPARKDNAPPARKTTQAARRAELIKELGAVMSAEIGGAPAFAEREKVPVRNAIKAARADSGGIAALEKLLAAQRQELDTRRAKHADTQAPAPAHAPAETPAQAAPETAALAEAAAEDPPADAGFIADIPLLSRARPAHAGARIETQRDRGRLFPRKI